MQVSAINSSPVFKAGPSSADYRRDYPDSYTQVYDDFSDGDEYLPDESLRDDERTYSKDLANIEGAWKDVRTTATKAANETDKKSPLMTALSVATIGVATFTAAQKGQAALAANNNKVLGFVNKYIGAGLEHLNKFAQSSSKFPAAAKNVVGKITPDKVISTLAAGGVLKEAFEDRNGNGLRAVEDKKERVLVNLLRQVAEVADGLN